MMKGVQMYSNFCTAIGSQVFGFSGFFYAWKIKSSSFAQQNLLLNKLEQIPLNLRFLKLFFFQHHTSGYMCLRHSFIAKGIDIVGTYITSTNFKA